MRVMNVRPRRPLLIAATAALALTMLTGIARADVSPSPTDATPTDTAAPGVSSPSPSPSTGDTGVPVPPYTPAAPSARGSASPTPSVSASAPAAPADPALPPNDGALPSTGQLDQYLALTAQRDQQAALVAQRTTDASTAHALTLWFQEQGVAVANTTWQAQDAAKTAQQSTDDVIRQLYQQGDAGLGELGSILAAGPDGFLQGLDNVRMATSTANGVWNQSVQTQADLALAVATQEAYQARLAQAQANETNAAALLVQAKTVLAQLDVKLAALDLLPPQVAVGPDGCPTTAVPGTLRDGSELVGIVKLCRTAVAQAATPQAALAITWAFQHLGAVYACGGAGRMLPWRADCSSYVSRAYHEGAGLGTAGDTWAPSTRDMIPWDGAKLDPHYVYVPPTALRPGDLVLYNSCPQGGCPYRHVVMYLGSPDHGKTFFMAHTNSCGDVAHVSQFAGFPVTGDYFEVARRVVALPGEKVRVPTAQAQIAAAAAASHAAAVSAASQAQFTGH